MCRTQYRTEVPRTEDCPCSRGGTMAEQQDQERGPQDDSLLKSRCLSNCCCPGISAKRKQKAGHHFRSRLAPCTSLFFSTFFCLLKQICVPNPPVTYMRSEAQNRHSLRWNRSICGGLVTIGARYYMENSACSRLSEQAILLLPE